MPTLIKLYIELYVWLFRMLIKYFIPLLILSGAIGLLAAATVSE